MLTQLTHGPANSFAGSCPKYSCLHTADIAQVQEERPQDATHFLVIFSAPSLMYSARRLTSKLALALSFAASSHGRCSVACITLDTGCCSSRTSAFTMLGNNAARLSEADRSVYKPVVILQSSTRPTIQQTAVMLARRRSQGRSSHGRAGRALRVEWPGCSDHSPAQRYVRDT